MASNQYSPTAEQPYQPTPGIDIVPPPAPVTAPQNPAPTGIQAQGNISHVGAAAGIADNILRGFMQGRAQAQAQAALKQARNAKMYENSYNLASQNLLQMHQAGVDPNSEQYKQAKDAVDASFNALNLYQAQIVGGPDKKPKKGGAKGQQQQPQTVGEMIQSKDPHTQAQGG